MSKLKFFQRKWFYLHWTERTAFCNTCGLIYIHTHIVHWRSTTFFFVPLYNFDEYDSYASAAKRQHQTSTTTHKFLREQLLFAFFVCAKCCWCAQFEQKRMENYHVNYEKINIETGTGVRVGMRVGTTCHMHAYRKCMYPHFTFCMHFLLSFLLCVCFFSYARHFPWWMEN